MALLVSDPDNLGIGIDIEEIARFKGLHPLEDRDFLGKIFTMAEQSCCFARKNPAPHLAVRFAAKEALVKAVCSLTGKVVDLSCFEIENRTDGCPVVKIQDPGLQKLKAKVSLSHCSDRAIAIAVVGE